MKKMLAGNEKGCTFAPANDRTRGRNEGSEFAKFFDSLRPAQEAWRDETPGGARHADKEPRKESEGGPEIDRRNKQESQ